MWSVVKLAVLTRPWPPIYLRLASTIRYARRAVDERSGRRRPSRRSRWSRCQSIAELSFSYISSIPAASASLTYHRAHHLTSLASRIAFVLLFTLDWLSVSCVGYHHRAYYSWQHRLLLDWTGTDRLHRLTPFTTTTGQHTSPTCTTTGFFTHASQPWNNDSHCRHHSLHCALSLSHVWTARKNAIVRCYCSAIVNHKAVISLAQYSRSILP